MELPPSVTATFPLSPENLDLFHDISHWLRPGARPTNNILIKFENRPKFAGHWFKMYSTDVDQILLTSRQCSCRDMCKMLLLSVKHVLN